MRNILSFLAPAYTSKQSPGTPFLALLRGPGYRDQLPSDHSCFDCISLDYHRLSMHYNQLDRASRYRVCVDYATNEANMAAIVIYEWEF